MIGCVSDGIKTLAPFDDDFHMNTNGSEMEKVQAFLSEGAKTKAKCLVTIMVSDRKEMQTSRWTERCFILCRHYTVSLGSQASYVMCVVQPLTSAVPSPMQGTFYIQKPFRNESMRYKNDLKYKKLK